MLPLDDWLIHQVRRTTFSFFHTSAATKPNGVLLKRGNFSNLAEAEALIEDFDFPAGVAGDE